MKKKTLLSVIAAATLAVTVFAGCGKKEDTATKIKDGTYKAEASAFDDKGYKPFVEVEYKDGKIASAKFDYTNEKDGTLKSANADYNKAMAAKSGTSPDKYTVELAKALVEKQDVEKVDTVTGATHSSENFKTLVKAAVDNATAGKTDTAKVEIK
ncbi:FMN-binding protein [Clostridium intestinale]|uniref:FMN-binding protein n=1 Tax=Clostridium intestinale TaxID=36845 RepID=UPI002DD66100|nr:FMN-binding protein [Clostridium intestinale]WRY49924.1 FMN-binding protein [Clostridium intestinale]